MNDTNSYTTRVPNEVFDQSLKYLTLAELKVLFIIIRQTIGWRDPKTGKPKTKDWISRSFFQKRSQLSYKSISLGIQGLIEKKLIVTTDRHGYVLKSAKERRGKKKIYFAYAPYFKSTFKATRVKKLSQLGKKLPYTKDTLTKELSCYKKYQVRNTKGNHQTMRRLTDAERYRQILHEQKRRAKQ